MSYYLLPMCSFRGIHTNSTTKIKGTSVSLIVNFIKQNNIECILYYTFSPLYAGGISYNNNENGHVSCIIFNNEKDIALMKLKYSKLHYHLTGFQLKSNNVKYYSLHQKITRDFYNKIYTKYIDNSIAKFIVETHNNNYHNNNYNG